MSKKLDAKKLNQLFRDYDIARSEAKGATADQAEINKQIKELLGDTTKADTPDYICTFMKDKDGQVEVFDEEGFKKKQPAAYKLYRKFCKMEKTEGVRKLVVTAKNAEE
jgi:hypothetical protein